MPFTYSDQEQRDAVLVREATLAVSQGELEPARSLLADVIERAPDPDEYQAIVQDGDVLYWRYWDEDEREFFEQLLQSQPGAPKVVWLPSVYPKAYFLLGLIAVQQGDLTEVIPKLRAAFELDPSSPEPLIELAAMLSARGQHGLSNTIYESALTCRPAHPPWITARILRGRGFNEIELGNLTAARALFEESLENDPTSPVPAQEIAYIDSLEHGGQTVTPNVMVTGHGVDISYPGQPGPGMIELVNGLRELVETGALTQEEFDSVEQRLLGTTQVRVSLDYFRCRVMLKMIAALYDGVVEGTVPLRDFAEKKAEYLEAMCTPLEDESSEPQA